MPEQLKINDPDEIAFVTARTINSKLWFVNNDKFVLEILTYLARYQSIYNVLIYSFIIMGDHYHLIAKWPDANRSAFMRDFDRCFSRAALRNISNWEGGPMWGRRYRPQNLPTFEDVEHWSLYSAANPIISGISKDIDQYEGYNGFRDSISGKPKKYKWIDYTKYQNNQRHNKNAKPQDFVEHYELKYSRIPGNEHLSDKEYKAKMMSKYRAREAKEIQKRIKAGHGFASPEQLRKIKPGTSPRHTKTSTRYSRRPLVLTLCAETRKRYLDSYFAILHAYRIASRKYREGNYDVKFPPGTFLPTTCNSTTTI